MIVAAPEHWDEACFAVPAVRALMASGLETGILCPQEQRKFWETLPGLTIIDYPARVRAKVIAGQISGNWQASLAWEAGLAADAFEVAKIPRRLGLGERQLAKRLTHPLDFSVSPLEHRVRFYLAAVEELGMATARPEFFEPVELPPSPSASAEAVLLSPGSDFGASHEWPLARWVEIYRALTARGLQVTIANMERRRALGEKLVQQLGCPAHYFQANPLGTALPVFALFRLVIAADGSLPHLAAHVGVTCVTLFGPNDPAWKRPLGKRHAVVRRHVECAPCLLAKCPLDGRCQNELETSRVLQAIAEKLG
jgi:ADP-heptose:LPS heptosyltransferase